MLLHLLKPDNNYHIFGQLSGKEQEALTQPPSLFFDPGYDPANMSVKGSASVDQNQLGSLIPSIMSDRWTESLPQFRAITQTHRLLHPSDGWPPITQGDINSFEEPHATDNMMPAEQHVFQVRKDRFKHVKMVAKE
ncbi:uncharacterized protein LOC144823886 isoform X2 [Lissotriton helveticus]